MAGKVWLVGRDVLDGHNSTAGLELEDAVDQEKRSAVGEQLLDALDFEGKFHGDRGLPALAVACAHVCEPLNAVRLSEKSMIVRPDPWAVNPV